MVNASYFFFSLSISISNYLREDISLKMRKGGLFFFLILKLIAVSGFTGLSNSISSSTLVRSIASSRIIRNAEIVSLPSGNNEELYSRILQDSISSTKAALKNKEPILEIEYPVLRGKIDVSLMQYLDETRNFAREFIRSFSSQYDRENLVILFGDTKEANLARKNWGDPYLTTENTSSENPSKNNFFTGFLDSFLPPSKSSRLPDSGLPFTVTDIETYKNYIEASTEDNMIENTLIIVVTPGYNVEEWINLSMIGNSSKLRGGSSSIVIINGGLDKLRSGYYPQLFYPELARVSKLFYQKFVPAYYLKPVSNGYVYNLYPNNWQVHDIDGDLFKDCGTDKPDFKIILSELRDLSMRKRRRG